MLRTLLVVLATALIVWWPFSYHYEAQAILPRWCVTHMLILSDGVLEVWKFKEALPYEPEVSWGPQVGDGRRFALQLSQSLWPRVEHRRLLGAVVEIPLWLLAFICLAWPGTSFILARRRRKARGFEVGARPGAGPGTDQAPFPPATAG